MNASWATIVDKIYVITTSKSDRLKDFIQSMPFDHNLIKVHNMQIKEEFQVQHYPNTGNYKNEKTTNAFKTVFKDAIDYGYNKVLIFEDDARFDSRVSKDTVQKILNWIQTNDWDFFFLGHLAIGPQFMTNEYIVRTHGSLLNHAVCYSRKMLLLLYNHLQVTNQIKWNYFHPRNHNKPYYSNDDFIRVECPHVKAYACRPTLFYQCIETPDIVKARKAGIFPGSKIEDWQNSVNDSVIGVTGLIILIPLIILIVLIVALIPN